MMLGELLAQFDDEAAAAEIVCGLCDFALLARLRSLADAAGQPLGAYAGDAVRRYIAAADDAEWITLLGTLQRAADPGEACLRRALAHAPGSVPASGLP
jgi:hypothetical protein